jgi:hypothetical protein
VSIDRQELLHRLRAHGAAIGGQHWAVLAAEAWLAASTPEAWLAASTPPLPYAFPGTRREAEALCTEAGCAADAAAILHTQAQTTWNQLLGPKRRQPS